MNRFDADLIVVGSGPAGAQAAKKAVELGLRVLTVDVGVDDRSLADSIPAEPFSALRRGDDRQSLYFFGNLDESDISSVKTGAHLTPPRAYIVRDVDDLTPLESETFHPLLSLAKGGLGAGWGAGCETFTAAECRRAGLDHEQIRSLYQEVATDIGISGAKDDDTSMNLADFDDLQQPLPLDDNAAAIFATYSRRRDALQGRGFILGRPPTAILSQRLERDGVVREANPLFDMDMYNDVGHSIYRPWLTIESLARSTTHRYAPGLLAIAFNEIDDGIELICREMSTGSHVRFLAARLVLAAGALNTTRIVLRSLRAVHQRRPLLCNRYRYIPAINLAMLGRPTTDRRHSLAQLAATLSCSGDDPEQIFIGIYSYRSLLLYRLVQQMPLPPRLGLLAARVLLSSLTVLGIHFPDAPTSAKWVELASDERLEHDVLRAEYVETPDEEASLARGMRAVLGAMTNLRMMPLSIVDPGNGSSIHYAGPLGISRKPEALATSPEGSLFAARRVYVGDSAAWNFLPAKGPTLTIMAHARNVVAAAFLSFGEGRFAERNYEMRSE